jgi:phage-related minor tail protein
MDYSISIPIIEKWPKIKGNEKNRIKLETYDSSESDRIRCSYLKFLGKDGRFIKLEYLEIDHSKKDECEVEASTSQNNEKREYQVRAVRKKAILIDEVEEECFGLSEESALIRDLESHFEKISNLKIEIQSEEQQKTLVTEAERNVDLTDGGECNADEVTANEQRDGCSVDQHKGDSADERKLRKQKKVGKQQKYNQTKIEKDSSDTLDINDCSKLVTVFVEGDKDCVKILKEDKNKSILESVSVEQVADKLVVKDFV